MPIACALEHNGNDSLLYAVNYPGAFARGKTKEEALGKIPAELTAYCRWCGIPTPEDLAAVITQEKESRLSVCDADSDILLCEERPPLSAAEYRRLKALALKSAADFLTLYRSIPNAKISSLPPRSTFYGALPRTAEEMAVHTKNVNTYYFREIGVPADNEGSILDCRKRGFSLLEQQDSYLDNPVTVGSFGEEWSLRKLLRRFIWHDRIHAKAMVRMARRAFPDAVPDDPFGFSV